jgi:hypothetical protein
LLDEADLPATFLEQCRLGLAIARHKRGRHEEAAQLLIDAADAATRPAARLLLRDRAERAARAAEAPERPAVLTADSDPRWADRALLGLDDEGGL